MISSDANMGDRPARRHFNKIEVAALSFMVIAILVGMSVISAKKTSLGSSDANPASRSRRQQMNIRSDLYVCQC
jgi:hypothetical protein